MYREKLIREALKAKENAYAPYSKFKVGAALLTEDGEIYTGCNIENAAYSPTVCAERTAIFKAVSEGARKIEAIAIVAGEDMAYPCGVCRQVIKEFGEEATIIVARSEEDYEESTLEDLLPHSFGPKDLE